MGANGSKSEVNGLWKVPYLAEENADEDPEILFSTASEGGAMQKAKAALQKSGKPVSRSAALPHCKKQTHVLARGKFMSNLQAEGLDIISFHDIDQRRLL